jgi:UDP-N-acetyl-D-glucosamine dehydrogenase
MSEARLAEEAKPFETLLRQIETRQAVLGIVGMGYVGLPLALAGIETGFGVLGFDINARRVEAINNGDQVARHIDAAEFQQALDSGRFEATADMSRLAEADAILICVPTPVTRHQEPDLSYVVSTAEAIAQAIRPGQIVVLESTTWPGTTREVVQPILERSGLQVGRDIFLAYSPEREDPGNASFKTRSIPKVVGADDTQSAELATKLYEKIVAKVVVVSSAAAAEAAKLTENIYRAVNIALVNELKVVYAAMGVDIWEVIDAAATKPFGYTPFYPGPGMGGHCIPVDPFYLTWKAREYGMDTRFIHLAGQMNVAMPRMVVQRLAEALNQATGRGLKDAKVLVMGVAYKRNVEDTRESPSLVMIEQLESRGARCDFHDPFVEVIPVTRGAPGLSHRRSQALSPEMVAGYDVILIATDHDAVDYGMIAEHGRLVVDTRNIMARLGLSNARVAKA